MDLYIIKSINKSGVMLPMKRRRRNSWERIGQNHEFRRNAFHIKKEERAITGASFRTSRLPLIFSPLRYAGILNTKANGVYAAGPARQVTRSDAVHNRAPPQCWRWGPPHLHIQWPQARHNRKHAESADILPQARYRLQPQLP